MQFFTLKNADLMISWVLISEQGKWWVFEEEEGEKYECLQQMLD